MASDTAASLFVTKLLEPVAPPWTVEQLLQEYAADTSSGVQGRHAFLATSVEPLARMAFDACDAVAEYFFVTSWRFYTQRFWRCSHHFCNAVQSQRRDSQRQNAERGKQHSTVLL